MIVDLKLFSSFLQDLFDNELYLFNTNHVMKKFSLYLNGYFITSKNTWDATMGAMHRQLDKITSTDATKKKSELEKKDGLPTFKNGSFLWVEECGRQHKFEIKYED